MKNWSEHKHASLSFLTVSMTWPAASCFCCQTFSARIDGIHWGCKINKTFSSQVSFLMYFDRAARKVATSEYNIQRYGKLTVYTTLEEIHIIWYYSIVKPQTYLILSYLTTVNAHSILAAFKSKLVGSCFPYPPCPHLRILKVVISKRRFRKIASSSIWIFTFAFEEATDKIGNATIHHCLFFLFFSAKDWTQSPKNTSQVLFGWTASPALIPFHFYFYRTLRPTCSVWNNLPGIMKPTI